jgi:hypothetical protein
VNRAALWPSRWPAEDGGPPRDQLAPGTPLQIGPTERLTLAAHRDAYAATMFVLRDPGQLFVLHHTIGARPLRDSSTCWWRSLGPEHSFGWDPVIAGGHVWFLDNGAHDYATTMRGAARSPGPVRLIRVAVADPADTEIVEVTGRAIARTRIARTLANRSSRPARSPAIRRALTRQSADEVIVVDIETGVERARTRVPTMFQSVLSPAPGFGRDLYWCTFSTLARLEVTAAA